MATFTIKVVAVLLAVAVHSVSAETDCGDPGDIENGAVNASRGTGYLDVVTYSCDPGFTLNGESARACESDGTWGCDAPTCDPIDCGNPPNLEDGVVDLADGTTFRSVIAYGCDVGYNLNGVSERVCQRDGTWGCADPICSEVDCGFSGNLTNGEVTVLGRTAYGDEVIYRCNENYTLYGDGIRTCQLNGTWTGFDPFCNIDRCPYESESYYFSHEYTTKPNSTLGYFNDNDMCLYWESAEGTNITITFPYVRIECTRNSMTDCPDNHKCPYDWAQITDSGVPMPRFCGNSTNYQVTGLSNHVELWFHSDAVGSNEFDGLAFNVTYWPLHEQNGTVDQNFILFPSVGKL